MSPTDAKVNFTPMRSQMFRHQPFLTMVCKCVLVHGGQGFLNRKEVELMIVIAFDYINLEQNCKLTVQNILVPEKLSIISII